MDGPGAAAKLNAAIIFAPAGAGTAALGALKKGGVLVLGGIHMSAKRLKARCDPGSGGFADELHPPSKDSICR